MGCVDCKEYDRKHGWCSWYGAFLSDETAKDNVECDGYKKKPK